MSEKITVTMTPQQLATINNALAYTTAKLMPQEIVNGEARTGAEEVIATIESEGLLLSLHTMELSSAVVAYMTANSSYALDLTKVKGLI